MLCMAWNVNGLRAVSRKGFLDWLDEAGPDVLLLQETKARAEDLQAGLREPPGWSTRFHHAVKKGYSGVGIYARREPDEWIVGLGEQEFDDEGRMLSARFGDLVVASVYFPNSQGEGLRLPYRLAFGAAFLRFCERQRALGRHVLVGGDYNVAHEEIDIARPKENVRNAGFLPEEREWFGSFLAEGWVDTFRRSNPEARDRYSWWSFRANARARNVGWRLDYFCCDEALWPRIGRCDILPDVTGSDHCPVLVEVEAESGTAPASRARKAKKAATPTKKAVERRRKS